MPDRRLRSLALETVAFVRSACALARAKHLDARRRAIPQWRSWPGHASLPTARFRADAIGPLQSAAIRHPSGTAAKCGCRASRLRTAHVARRTSHFAFTNASRSPFV
jgi:hypothetical protein